MPRHVQQSVYAKNSPGASTDMVQMPIGMYVYILVHRGKYDWTICVWRPLVINEIYIVQIQSPSYVRI